MRRAVWSITGLALIVALAALGWTVSRPAAMLTEAELHARYSQPPEPLVGRPAVFHLGNEMTGRVMPQGLAGFAGTVWHSQLGHAARLRDHQDGRIADFDEMNLPPFFRPAAEAIASGDYPVIVLSTSIDAADDPDEAAALAYWAGLARQTNPGSRVYLYPTLSDPLRLTAPPEEVLLRRAMADPATGTIHVIPVTRVFAEISDAIEAGELPEIAGIETLFDEDGGLSDLGAYTVALVQYTTFQGRAPDHLPDEIWLFEGRYLTAPPPAVARTLQELVWKVVSDYPATGVAQVGPVPEQVR